MIECGGVWLPDGEQHMVEWMTKKNLRINGKLTYQYEKLVAAIAYCSTKRVAVDIGAHVGLWSMHLAREFKFVHAFEPVAAHRECFERNVTGGLREHVGLYPFALGQAKQTISIESPPTSSGGSRVAGEGDIPMRLLDSFALRDVDFIKVDCEGYELPILRGGEETLLINRPCVIVEQKPGRAQHFGFGETDAVAYLQGLGATLRNTISGDFILTF